MRVLLSNSSACHAQWPFPFVFLVDPYTIRARTDARAAILFHILYSKALSIACTRQIFPFQKQSRPSPRQLPRQLIHRHLSSFVSIIRLFQRLQLAPTDVRYETQRKHRNRRRKGRSRTLPVNSEYLLLRSPFRGLTDVGILSDRVGGICTMQQRACRGMSRSSDPRV